MKILDEKLDTALKNLEALSEQLQKTRDYSEKSELVFLLRELVREQISAKNNTNNEDAHYTISATR